MHITQRQRLLANHGFTLIELLVVIAIISILATFGFITYNGARAQARDSKRIEDLQKVANALEAYYNENGSYPPTPSTSWRGACDTYDNSCNNDTCDFSGANGWIPNLAPDFIAQLPDDPRNDGGYKCYLYKSDGNDYMLLAHQTMETLCDGNDSDEIEDPGDECNPPHIQALDRTNPTYEEPTIAIYTPGAADW